jgi:hypothetical protein
LSDLRGTNTYIYYYSRKRLICSLCKRVTTKGHSSNLTN